MSDNKCITCNYFYDGGDYFACNLACVELKRKDGGCASWVKKYIPKNRDRIRSMSNEELAELFIGYNDNGLFCTIPGARFVANFDEEEKLKAWIVEYLESEAENDPS